MGTNMKRSEQLEHQQRVEDFLRECEETDPEHFKDVCEKYPVLTTRRWKTIQKRECPSGLLTPSEGEHN